MGGNIAPESFGAFYDAVAIDGPAGSGKSTIARAVAAQLGFLYIDTGAMYRTVALAAVRRGVPLEDEAAMAQLAQGIGIAFDATGTRVLLDGEDVSAPIRTPEITNITKFAAHAPGVRARLVELQQQMARNRPAVMEGRDITTVVLPGARWKFFVTASPEERARRRMKDFTAGGHAMDFDKLLQDIIARDASDNAVGPMKQAQEIARAGGGITLLDTTGLTPDEVIARMVAQVRK